MNDREVAYELNLSKRTKTSIDKAISALYDAGLDMQASDAPKPKSTAPTPKSTAPKPTPSPRPKAAKKSAAGLPGDVEALSEKAVSYDLSGDEAKMQGNSKKAKESYKKSINLRKKILEIEPDNLDALGNLADLYDQLGFFAMEEDKYAQAKKYHTQALQTRQNIFELTPDNPQTTYALGVSFGRIADALEANGDVVQAIEYHKKAAEISASGSSRRWRVRIGVQLGLYLYEIGSPLRTDEPAQESAEYHKRRSRRSPRSDSGRCGARYSSAEHSGCFLRPISEHGGAGSDAKQAKEYYEQAPICARRSRDQPDNLVALGEIADSLQFSRLAGSGHDGRASERILPTSGRNIAGSNAILTITTRCAI